MANRITHKSSSVAGVKPTLTDLAYGELAINIVDGVVFIRRSDDVILEIAAKVPLIWLTPVFKNGWVDYGGSWSAKYAQDVTGDVHIKGLVKGGNRSNNSIIFTLPVGMRPSSSIMYNNKTQYGNARIDIASNGSVSYIGGDSTGRADIWLAITAVFRGEI